jgi:hypothetical protein
LWGKIGFLGGLKRYTGGGKRNLRIVILKGQWVVKSPKCGVYIGVVVEGELKKVKLGVKK